MLSKILIVAATDTESDALMNIPGIKSSVNGFSLGKSDISLLVTGVGSVATSWALGKWFSSNPKPELAINIGIAGSFRDEISPGEVVVPVSDCFADAGIETERGFITLSEAGFQDPSGFPFREGKIISDNKFVDLTKDFCKHVNAITVNTASGSDASIERLLKKFNPDIETMEGATFFYICTLENVPFLAFRSISNRVEPRNKNNWNIPVAIDNLSEKLKDFILMLD